MAKRGGCAPLPHILCTRSDFTVWCTNDVPHRDGRFSITSETRTILSTPKLIRRKEYNTFKNARRSADRPLITELRTLGGGKAIALGLQLHRAQITSAPAGLLLEIQLNRRRCRRRRGSCAAADRIAAVDGFACDAV